MAGPGVPDPPARRPPPVRGLKGPTPARRTRSAPGPGQPSPAVARRPLPAAHPGRRRCLSPVAPPSPAYAALGPAEIPGAEVAPRRRPERNGHYCCTQDTRRIWPGRARPPRLAPRACHPRGRGGLTRRRPAARRTASRLLRRPQQLAQPDCLLASPARYPVPRLRGRNCRRRHSLVTSSHPNGSTPIPDRPPSSCIPPRRGNMIPRRNSRQSRSPYCHCPGTRRAAACRRAGQPDANVAPGTPGARCQPRRPPREATWPRCQRGHPKRATVETPFPRTADPRRTAVAARRDTDPPSPSPSRRSPARGCGPAGVAGWARGTAAGDLSSAARPARGTPYLQGGDGHRRKAAR